MQMLKVFAFDHSSDGLNESKYHIATTVLSRAISRTGRHALFAVLGGLAVCPAWAANFTVTSLADSGAGTLRQAIFDAEANADPANTIAVPAGTITLGSTLPAISKTLTIQGAGAGNTSISGNNAVQIFTVTAGTAGFSDLELRNGTGVMGGAIYTGATPTINITNVRFSNNVATSEGGAIYNHGGTVTIGGSEFAANKAMAAAGRGGGAILTGGPLTIERSTFSQNTTAVAGGAISHDAGLAALTIRDSIFDGNSTPINSTPGNSGGAIAHPGGGQFTIERTLFTGNKANDGGAIVIGGDATVSVKNSTFRQNQALNTNASFALGGAIYRSGISNLTVDDSLFDRNTARQWAGAISSMWGGTMTVNRSTFVGNEATGGYGGAINASGGMAGIYRSSITIDSCTFSGNKATRSALLGRPSGGALDLDLFNTIKIVNSTFSGNSIGANGLGGSKRGSAIIVGTGNLSIESSTFAENSGSAAIYFGNSSQKTATVSINNSIVSGNLNGDFGVDSGWTGTPLATAITQSLTNPVSGGASGLFADLMLTPLQDNGGPVNGIPGSAGNFGPMLTHAPLDGSPVIDAGAWGGVLTSDQRGTGFDRVWGAAQDLGAVEFQITANTPPPYVPIRTHAIVTDTMIRGIEHKSIQGVLAPHPNDLGMDGAIFVFAWLPERVEIAPNTLWFFDSARNWHLFTDCRVTSPYYTGTLQILRDIPVVHEPADLSIYSGAQLYLGYGLGGYAAPSGSACNDMIARTSYVLVKTLE